MADITGAHTSTETSWIHLDSLESEEKSDDYDIQSWVSMNGSDDEDEREFEEPQVYETKSHSASGQTRLDCGRNNSKSPLVITENLLSVKLQEFSIFLSENITKWYLETLIPRRAGKIRKRTNSNESNVSNV